MLDKITPKPWHVVEYGDGDQLVVCSDEAGDWRIAFLATPGGARSSWDAIQADANLIAAAPDLYEALHDVMLRFGPGTLNQGLFERACAALAKARGETIDEMAV